MFKMTNPKTKGNAGTEGIPGAAAAREKLYNPSPEDLKRFQEEGEHFNNEGLGEWLQEQKPPTKEGREEAYKMTFELIRKALKDAEVDKLCHIKHEDIISRTDVESMGDGPIDPKY